MLKQKTLKDSFSLSGKGGAASAHRTVVLIAPYAGRERQALCRQIIAAHRSTTVDNRGYLLVFNNHLPKQHFQL